MEFLGYPRPDGTVGVRNHLAVLASVFCANQVVENIAHQVPGAVPLTHPLGCSQVGADLEQTARTLISLGRHPNVGAVLVVGLGCERFPAQELYAGVAASGKPVEMVVIQEAGDSLRAVEQGTRLARRLMEELSRQERESCDISHLTVGLKCGGTDATSGIAANPAVGVMSDLLVQAGGSTILTEVTELLGAEHILAQRAVNPDVGEKIRATIAQMEERLRRAGSDQRFSHRGALISPGNMDGGVTTVVEKALGGITKSGSAPFVDVLDYGERIKKKGLHLLDSPGHDGESVTGLVAAGAQIIVFTTGRGTPTGFPIAPVVKVTGNPTTYQRMKENIDYNAGAIIEGEKTIAQAGTELLAEILAVANGKRTKAEILGHRELLCIARL